MPEAKVSGEGWAMIAVTECAKEELKTILIESEAGPEEGLRLLPRPDGLFIVTLDSKLPGDQVVEYQGFKVLLVGIEYSKLLDGKSVECMATEDGMVLFVR